MCTVERTPGNVGEAGKVSLQDEPDTSIAPEVTAENSSKVYLLAAFQLWDRDFAWVCNWPGECGAASDS